MKSNSTASSKRYAGEDFEPFLQQVLDRDGLEPVDRGITLQVKGRGVKSLSRAQLYRFEHNVMAHYFVESCSRCGQPIPFDQMLEAADSGGFCDWCAHMDRKDD